MLGRISRQSLLKELISHELNEFNPLNPWLIRTVFQCGNFLLNRVTHEFFSIAVFKHNTAEVVFGRLMADLLKGNVDAGIQYGAGNWYQNAQFFCVTTIPSRSAT